MSSIHSANCSADERALLMKNVWKSIQIGSSHVRISQPNSYAPAMPQGPVQYMVTVEVLQQADTTQGYADPQCAAVIVRLFPAIK